ncbi:MAG TPA: LPS assembly lipoprotein LptE [Candidatus Eremiobacteraceae bacterium]|nr:LPS assembly lipoprotein LptE [Candidatus Eremiobacteraceae bacterium]
MTHRVASLASACLAACLFASGCGYHVAGHGPDALPKTIQVIAVPPLENKTNTFKIEQKLTAATIHEFLAATRYKIVSDANAGDAVLTGKVLSLEVVPLLFQSSTSTTASSTTSIAQATAMMITMRCEVTLTERDNDKVLYHTDNFVFRNQYQLATTCVPGAGQICPVPTDTKSQVESFFQEGQPATDRMARDFATRLVSAVTENF